MKSVLSLNDMLIPKIITVIYQLFLILAILAGVGVFIALSTDRFGPGPFVSFLLAAAVAVVAALVARIWSEMLIVQFKINEALQEIRTK